MQLSSAVTDLEMIEKVVDPVINYAHQWESEVHNVWTNKKHCFIQDKTEIGMLPSKGKPKATLTITTVAI